MEHIRKGIMDPQHALTAKANFKRVFTREKTEWIPTRNDYFFFSPRVLPDNLARVLINEAQVLREEEWADGADMFGIGWTFVPEVQGSITKPGNPLLSSISEWHTKLVWPDVDSWSWDESEEQNRPLLEMNANRFVSITILSGFFERLISFLDFENACLALIDEDEKPAVHALFERLCGLYESIILKLKKHFNPDMIEFHDDWGAQRSPFFSLSVCREMILPYLKRLVSFSHAQGIYFQLHSCGCVEPLIPAIIEAGVDMWIPQYNANNLELIHKKYGDKIVTATRRMLQPDTTPDEAVRLIDLFYDVYTSELPQKPILFFDDFPSEELKAYFQSRLISLKVN